MARFEAGMESMVDTYIFETTSLLEKLDQMLMQTENESGFSSDEINEIFRIMHTIKGSSAMMGLDNISKLAHSVEDMFYIIRDQHPVISDMKTLYDLLFSASDLLKAEVDLAQQDTEPTDFSAEMNKIASFADILKGGSGNVTSAYAGGSAPKTAAAAPKVSEGLTGVKVTFAEGCLMENLRALLVVNQIREMCAKLEYTPADIETNPDSAKLILSDGFIIGFKPAEGKTDDEIIAVIKKALNVKSCEPLNAPAAKDAPKQPDALPKDAVILNVRFEDGCLMENLRALIVVNNIKSRCKTLSYVPNDIETNPETAKTVISKGFVITYTSENPDEVINIVKKSPNVKSVTKEEPPKPQEKAAAKAASKPSGPPATLISVNLNKLDSLMDLVGEIVIAESMVTLNPELKGVKLDSFTKSARQLRKLISELRDGVTSLRMVPISGAFQKMTRIVRDMKTKLNKDADLIFVGEETEVDKSVVDKLNDPLMHMVRNSMDHGIEDDVNERIAAGKPAKGKITLSARNTSSEVIITISDDGGGINAEKVLAKAKKNGMLKKPESEYTNKEIYGMIMLPGFSTNEKVTEFSGRGVGMDVVCKNINDVGGYVEVDSVEGQGSDFIIHIPLSLSIVDGMEISVGSSVFTIPISSVRESFKAKPEQLIHDTSGKEMMMIRGDCYPFLRLYDFYNIEPASKELGDGIVILAEAGDKKICLFADELIGEQQVVVKPFPALFNEFDVKKSGMAGCSVLGDGSITIILDAGGIIECV